ncbi:hypothetical protein CXF68_09015 [Tenacibaculum sp. Bg11-29]|uniref:energy transducer TonB n=1 Tax=Tenacibaculum sp. Bg11-29 TaxID=2058306 RepID=UPI000C340CD7|nr:energy transducer TonB [Tenacibaculum sp. Bg11-29]PKH50818.1 hypothetical protein CXF68_09015 [Tenacibaculum sp. Bg11-29]
MKKKYTILILLLSIYNLTYSQVTDNRKLEGKKIIKSFPINKSLFDEKTDGGFTVMIEKTPIFTGCESEKGNGVKSCYRKKVNEFITSNLRYPEIAKKNMIQGRVIAKYIIDKNGLISNVSVKGNEYLLDETIRLIKSFPKVTPAKQRGKSVKYEMTIPVYFKLDDK